MDIPKDHILTALLNMMTGYGMLDQLIPFTHTFWDNMGRVNITYNYVLVLPTMDIREDFPGGYTLEFQYHPGDLQAAACSALYDALAGFALRVTEEGLL